MCRCFKFKNLLQSKKKGKGKNQKKTKKPGQAIFLYWQPTSSLVGNKLKGFSHVMSRVLSIKGLYVYCIMNINVMYRRKQGHVRLTESVYIKSRGQSLLL